MAYSEQLDRYLHVLGLVLDLLLVLVVVLGLVVSTLSIVLFIVYALSWVSIRVAK